MTFEPYSILGALSSFPVGSVGAPVVAAVAPLVDIARWLERILRSKQIVVAGGTCYGGLPDMARYPHDFLHPLVAPWLSR